MSTVPDPSHWQSATDLLCVRLDGLGDLLMTTPALRALRGGVPGRKITLLTSPAGAAAAALLPEVDQVLVYDAPWVKASHLRTDSKPEHSMVGRLRQQRFDGAVIFTVYSQNPLPAALMCFLADIPLRLAHCHENAYQLLTHWIPDPEPFDRQRHEVRRQLDLVRAIGCTTGEEQLAVQVPDAAREYVLRLLREQHLDDTRGRPWVAIHPGASAPSRRYPEDLFAAAARQLVLETGCRVVFTGSEEERNLIGAIRRQMGVESVSLAGQLNVPQLAAFLQQAPLLIANNTGPVHLAAAVGTPVVDLYALTNPQHTPWGVPNRVLYHDVPCRFCYKSVCPEGHHACLRLVSPRSVVTAACELLKLTRLEIRDQSERSLADFQTARPAVDLREAVINPPAPVVRYHSAAALRRSAGLRVQHWPEGEVSGGCEPPGSPRTPPSPDAIAPYPDLTEGWV